MNNLKLPFFFKPKYKTYLERIGKDNDGGYVIPSKSIGDTDHLFSFGMYDDWSFESDFRKKNPNIQIIVFDKSVNSFFWVKRFIKNFLFLIGLKLKFNIFLKSLFTFFEYKFFFFNKNCKHIKKFIHSSSEERKYSDEKNFVSLQNILEKWNPKSFFLKIDIEGAEYRILEDIIANQQNLIGLVIEFHDCDLMSNYIKEFINKINLDLVHIHINNYGKTNSQHFPSVIELTFSKRIYNEKRIDGEHVFPVKNLDQPNNSNKADLKIEFINE